MINNYVLMSELPIYCLVKGHLRLFITNIKGKANDCMKSIRIPCSTVIIQLTSIYSLKTYF